MQGKLSVIEIVCYSQGRWFFLLPFKVQTTIAGKNTNTTIAKKAVSSHKFGVERPFNFTLCGVQLSLRYLGQIKLVSKKVDSFKVTWTM